VKRPAYQWYPRDFAEDEHVKLMSLAEEGAYRRLLDHQWLHGSIPSDLGQLAKVCKNTPLSVFRKLWPALSPCFLPSGEGRLINGRLERVREEVDEYRAKQSAAGKLGAEAAWGSGTGGDGTRYVYAMRRPSDGAIKIGASRTPAKRAERLGLHLLAQGRGGFAAERAAQIDLTDERIGTEWFTDSPTVRAWITNAMQWIEPRPDQGGVLVSPRPDQASSSATATAKEKPSRSRETWLTPFLGGWQRHRGKPSAGRLATSLRPLVEQRGPRQTLAAWLGYLESRDGKPFCTVEDFTANYEIHRGQWAVEIDEVGDATPIPDEPLAA
jgi:uncharacterized protein YdaU (DUF1376 family)